MMRTRAGDRHFARVKNRAGQCNLVAMNLVNKKLLSDHKSHKKTAKVTR